MRFDMRALSALVAAVALLSGCVVPPDLGPTTQSIPVYQVVERVKCELKKALSDDLEDAQKHPTTSPYWFLPGWNAGVDLSLIVNDQSGISPSVSFIQPLTVASLVGRVTNMSRSASVGVGGGVTTQAIRTEEMSFGLSLSKVLKELDGNPIPYRHCDSAGIDLNSDDLGLKEWVDSAFSPLNPPDTPGYRLLDVGAPMPSGPGGAQKMAPKDVAKLEQFRSLMAQTGADATPLGAQAAAATEEILKQSSSVPLRAIDKQLDSLNKLNSDLVNPEGQINTQIKSQPKIQNKTVPQQQITDTSDQLKSVTAQVLAIAEQMQKLAKQTPAKPKSTPLAPISAISHQVQFIVTWNINANPSWTLVHFKGPAAGSGSFVSAQQINTHTLTITLGPPAQGGGGGTLGADAQALRNSQYFNAAFQTLAPQLAFPP
jgi:hypothetical protein